MKRRSVMDARRRRRRIEYEEGRRRAKRNGLRSVHMRHPHREADGDTGTILAAAALTSGLGFLGALMRRVRRR